MDALPWHNPSMGEWFTEWFDADYAALYGHRDAAEAERAIQTALEAAPEIGKGPVLDLACGMGRHLEALRKHNALAFGLDLSAHLLGEAPEGIRPWLLRGDMRNLPLKPATLSGITLWFTPFGYFSDERNRALLFHLASLLRPGGVLILDFLNKALLERTLVASDLIERDGMRAHSRRTLEGNRIVKRMTLTRRGSELPREAMESVRLYSPEELCAMAREAGLECRRALGNYEGGPFRIEDSPRWIGIFQRNFKP